MGWGRESHEQAVSPQADLRIEDEITATEIQAFLSIINIGNKELCKVSQELVRVSVRMSYTYIFLEKGFLSFRIISKDYLEQQK